MEHTKHIWRALLALIVLALALITVRHFLIPKSFGEMGHYRFDSLAEFMAQAPVHGRPDACKECHEDEFDEKLEGKHASVQCEVCHAPLAHHVKGTEKIADMPVDRSPELCANCHRVLLARPKDMPQVKIREHLITTKAIQAGEAIPDGVCAKCHEAHNPSGD